MSIYLDDRYEGQPCESLAPAVHYYYYYYYQNFGFLKLNTDKVFIQVRIIV